MTSLVRRTTGRLVAAVLVTAAVTARPFLHWGERVRVRMCGRPCSSGDAMRIRARTATSGGAGTRVIAVFG